MIPISLKGNVAVVTGGGNGIGRAVCLRYAEADADIVVADIDLEKAQAVADEVAAMGCRSAAVQVDVSDEESVAALMHTANEIMGGFDILCNNAGIITRKTVEEMDVAKDWDRVMAVNSRGVFLCVKAAIPYLKERGGGRIISTASVAGKLGGWATGAAYCASKSSVILMTRVMATELAQYNILVNCVCPGNVQTDMARLQFSWDHEKTGISEEDWLKEWGTGIPLGRLAQADDIANMYLFLASDLASYITGDALNVAGGIVMI